MTTRYNSFTDKVQALEFRFAFFLIFADENFARAEQNAWVEIQANEM